MGDAGVAKEEIADEDALLRRITPEQIIRDENTGRDRPSSAAFKQLELSTDCERLLQKSGLDWKFSVMDYPSASLVKFFASVPRKMDLAVHHIPLDVNYAHTEIHGKKTQSKASQLALAAEWIHKAA